MTTCSPPTSPARACAAASRDGSTSFAADAYGFVTDVEQDIVAKGLNEDVIRGISRKKDEPEWLLEWRLKAYRHWLQMPMPDWAKLNIAPIDLQAIKAALDRLGARTTAPTLIWAGSAMSRTPPPRPRMVST